MTQEEIEARLFELIEQKPFGELDAAETKFVLQHMSREEFELQRTLISAAQNLEFPDAEPVPLPAPKARIVWYRRSIPLYQAIPGAAAVVLFFWLLRSPETTTISNNRSIGSSHRSNTTVPVTQVIYDTVIREVPVIHTAIRYVYDTVQFIRKEFYAVEPARQIRASNEFNRPELSEDLLRGVSSSVKEDQLSELLTHAVPTDMLGGH